MDLIQACATTFQSLLIYEYHFIIISGKITNELIQKSAFYEQMKGRIIPLMGLEKMLDENNIVFRYNKKVQKFSLIKADYLLEGNAKEIPAFLFLGKRNNDEREQMCRTFLELVI